VRRRFRPADLDFRALEGRRVRVRGWIERRAGPAIEVRHPSQIEVVEESEAVELLPPMAPR
jgi:micrococcal nuclease